MFLSRTLAKQRMAADVRPSFVGAWGLVLADAALLALIFALMYRPFQFAMAALEIPTFMVVMALVLLVFWALFRWRKQKMR